MGNLSFGDLFGIVVITIALGCIVMKANNLKNAKFGNDHNYPIKKPEKKPMTLASVVEKALAAKGAYDIIKMAKDSGYTPEEVMEAIKNSHGNNGNGNGAGKTK